MITLGILNEMCNWWWLWWLLSGIIGAIIGCLLCRCKSENRNENETLKDYEKKLSELEFALEDCKKRRKDLETKLHIALNSNEDSQENDVNPNWISSNLKSWTAMSSTSKYARIKEDNLQIIEGIGPKMNELLITNGITSWSVLSEKRFEDLRKILDLYGEKYRIIDPSEWPAQAAYVAKRDWDGLIAYQKSDGSESKAEKLMIKMGIIKAYVQDDLKAIEGIGPKIEKVLKDGGIDTWKILSTTNVEKLQELLSAAGERYNLADPSTWPKQAEYAANHDWEALEKYQDFLDGGKTPG